jgi:hypothetical protein
MMVQRRWIVSAALPSGVAGVSEWFSADDERPADGDDLAVGVGVGGAGAVVVGGEPSLVLDGGELHAGGAD